MLDTLLTTAGQAALVLVLLQLGTHLARDLHPLRRHLGSE